MIRAALLALLLPACSMAIAGDAHDACERITTAVRNMIDRCHGEQPRGSAAGFCDRAFFTDATSDQAGECEAWAAGVACKDIDATYSPACEFSRYP